MPAPEPVEDLVEMTQHGSDASGKLFTRASQTHAIATAQEQLRPQLSLEPRHVLTHRRLRHVQLLSCATEMELVGHSEERPQLKKVCFHP
ncbi:hypothetical protein ASG78_12330 [Nostocoides sp. Soil756]|nr:hypothetical protein ASG78_12330 [Tetrasphaera sp. Soil756]